jgi:hypothetical protein
VPVPLRDPPPGATRHGDEDFIVQDLVIEARNTRYRRERWLLPDGTTVLAPLPGDLTPGSPFGPTLVAFILQQYHGQRVTPPLLLEQLRQLGIDIAAGQLRRLLTEELEAFHQEKAELLPAGLQVSSYIGVDDTGARHRGRKVSGGTRSEAGRRCRDTFASLKKTCRCLGVHFWEYVQDRVRGRGLVPRLAELIRSRAEGAGAAVVVAAPA